MSPIVQVTLAAATAGDLPQLSAYLKSLRVEDPMPGETLADEVTTLAALSALIADPSLGRACLIHADGRPVGYVVLTFVHSIEFGGRCGFIDELYVEPQARGQGIGRAALGLIAELARLLGVRVLLLEVSPENARAAKLYEGEGFAERKYRMMAKRLFG